MMFKGCMQIVRGFFWWVWLCIRYKITYQKVVLVLTDMNKKLDYYALAHLEDFVNRKSVKQAIILGSNQEMLELARGMKYPFCVRIKLLSKKKIKILQDYYSIIEFFYNIVFTSTNIPKDNQLGRVLDETDVNEEDAVCLGLYHLRMVPAMQEKYMRELNV